VIDSKKDQVQIKPVHFVRYLGAAKGRQVPENAAAKVAQLLAPLGELSRDLLIEALHIIQDSEKCLPENLLNACARAFKLSQSEVFEVATFYHHFDVIKDGALAPPNVTVRVCESLSCQLVGASAATDALQAIYGVNPEQAQLSGVRIQKVPCIGLCNHGPAASIGKHAFALIPDLVRDSNQLEVFLANAISESLNEQSADSFAERSSLQKYIDQGGYSQLSLAFDQPRERLLAHATTLMKKANLRGLGGAGFPSANKWEIVASQLGEKLLVINADEGEPGTFKDKFFLEQKPHQFIEGALLAAYAIDASLIYIYLRDEYPEIAASLKREIAALQSYAQTRSWQLPRIELRRGAGAYICGEESALIESLEGKRGLPRLRPPYVAQVGLFGQPTLVHNVETLFWVPEILQAQGTFVMKRTYSVSGRVREPGVKIAPAGISVRSLIDDYCGGMQESHTLYAYLPGGASGGILPASLDHLALDFDKLQPYGSFIGSAAVIVLSQHDSARQAALSMMKFFQHETCGQCTPCRVGTAKSVGLMQSAHWDKPLALELAAAMADASICGLGQAAPNPMLSVFRYFGHEVGGPIN
jgi:formate dehydrogenase beta subunit